jgi:Cof subfamily protein (haloacid dehalogenase superfamily)
MRPRALVAFDLDGTLLDAEGRWHPEATKAIAALKDGGYALAVNTGRLAAGFALEAARRVNEEGLHVFSEGGLIGTVLGEPVQVHPFSEAATRRIYAIFKKHRFPALIPTASRTLHYIEGAPLPYREVFAARTGTPSFPIPPEALLRYPPLAVHFGGIPEPDWKVIAPLLEGMVEMEIHGPHEGRVYANIRPPGRDKGTALLALADLLGLPPEDTVMVGDGLNDVPGLERAGLGIAVQNAEERAKAAADVVVGKPGECGLLEAVEHIRTRFG